MHLVPYMEYFYFEFRGLVSLSHFVQELVTHTLRGRQILTTRLDAVS